MERNGELASHRTDRRQPIVVRRKNGTQQSINYSQTVNRPRPIEAEQVQLLAAQDLCGCGDIENLESSLIANVENPAAWTPAIALAQWKFSGDKHKSLQVDTEKTFHQRCPLVML